MPEKDDQENGAGAEIKDLVLDLNFVPKWARKPPGEVTYPVRSDERRHRDVHDRKRGRKEFDRDRRPARKEAGRSGAPPRQRVERKREATYERPERPERQERPERPERSERPERPEHHERHERLPVDLRFLPEQRQVSALVKQLNASKRAYPLPDIASLFMSDPGYCYVRIETRKGETRVPLYQCKQCKSVFLEPEALTTHIAQDHFEDFLQGEETEGEAPSGNFVCVARCGLSGVLLGPPNHHSYAAKVQETRMARYPEMAPEAYSQRIETVREPEVIEQWKEECRKQYLYKPRKASEQDCEPMKRAEADAYMREKIVHSLTMKAYKAVLPLDVACNMEDERLCREARFLWRRESRSPRSMLFALRAALRYKHLHVFNVGKGREFVSAVHPAPLDPKHVVDSIREVLLYLHDNPGCNRAELVEALRPGRDVESPEGMEIIAPLRWLVEKGHIVEFFNGTLSVPLASRKETA